MVLRVVFFALMALGLTGFGTVAWLSTRPPAATAAAQQAAVDVPVVTKKTVMVTARAIQAGSLLKPEDFVAKEVSLDGINADGLMVDSAEARGMMVGSMVRRAMGPGEMIRGDAVVRPGEHGFLAAVLGNGMRAITIGVDATSGSAGLIWPGDKVDVILTQSLTDQALPLGRRVAAETVLRATRVIAIDQQLMQGAAPVGGDAQSRTVTLEVAAEQAERLSVAMRLGRLSLSLRSASETADVTEGVSRPIWARDVSPVLGAEAAPVGENVIRVFQGGAQAKEFKF
jgi:pilus assembly protein CpaB